MKISNPFSGLWGAIGPRLMPFLMLLDARYLPLFFVESYQGYTIHLWLWQTGPQDTAGYVFSILGGIAWGFVYIGVIAWAEREQYNGWIAWTAFTALIFGVSAAIVHYWPTQGVLALLHAGFPLVGFMYTMAVHNVPFPKQLRLKPRKLVRAVRWLNAKREQRVKQLEQLVREARAVTERLKAESKHYIFNLEKARAAAVQEREKYAAEAEQQRLRAEQALADLRKAKATPVQPLSITKQAVVDHYKLLLKQGLSGRAAAEQMGFSAAALDGWVRDAEQASRNGKHEEVLA